MTRIATTAPRDLDRGAAAVPHPRAGFNAVFFTVMAPYLERVMRRAKRRVFADLPDTVLEIGPGVGANIPYLRRGSRLVAYEPNLRMHRRLLARAKRRGIVVDLHPTGAERIDLPDDAAPAVISALVLCSVTDLPAVLAEVHRVLRPGGRFAFVEHVAAPDGSLLRRLQHRTRLPWAWLFDGCSCERDIAAAIERAGFVDVTIDRYRVHTPLLPFNTHIAGTATKAATRS